MKRSAYFICLVSQVTIVFALSSCLQSKYGKEAVSNLSAPLNSPSPNGDALNLDDELVGLPPDYEQYNDGEVSGAIDDLIETLSLISSDPAKDVSFENISSTFPDFPEDDFEKEDVQAFFYIYLQGDSLLPKLSELDVIESVLLISTQQYTEGPLNKYKVTLKPGVRPDPYIIALINAGISQSTDGSDSDPQFTYILTPQGAAKLDDEEAAAAASASAAAASASAASASAASASAASASAASASAASASAASASAASASAASASAASASAAAAFAALPATVTISATSTSSGTTVYCPANYTLVTGTFTGYRVVHSVQYLPLGQFGSAFSNGFTCTSPYYSSYPTYCNATCTK